MNEAIRVKRPARGWICSVCGTLLSARYTAEQHCPDEVIEK